MTTSTAEAQPTRWQAVKTMIGELADLGYLITNGVPPVPDLELELPAGQHIVAIHGLALVATIRYEPVTYAVAVERAVLACLRYQAALQKQQTARRAA